MNLGGAGAELTLVALEQFLWIIHGWWRHSSLILVLVRILQSEGGNLSYLGSTATIELLELMQLRQSKEWEVWREVRQVWKVGWEVGRKTREQS